MLTPPPAPSVTVPGALSLEVGARVGLGWASGLAGGGGGGMVAWRWW
jgi:hypothetical protein